ncbi:hypothetical protein AVEN_216196-1 [Araneus ventricosus]|uniref:Uncharacterized protein n=1 Tax=Araneus ventricosus TaxID=182803 RepID=A0A4Y2U757_ARAVE|nr:hypothetical protein AVEN_31969-1 [Araneus ventricosus]GBO08643.1 hypothetical protein AVEN_216196-1 [Araneus ventricosus]
MSCRWVSKRDFACSVANGGSRTQKRGGLQKVKPGALSRVYRQLFAPNSYRSRVLKYSEKIVATFNLDLSPTPSETEGSNFSPFPRVREVETIDQSKESTLSDFEA